MGETFTEADKLRARALVNLRVRTGKMPHPNTLLCVDCGHAWSVGERRHEYDHPRGYTAFGKLDVEAVCTRCHHRRDDPRASKTHCIRGHEFTVENTGRKANGTRFCRACRTAHDRARPARGSAYWVRVNAKRRAH